MSLKLQDYQRLYITSALKLCISPAIHDRVYDVLDSARSLIVGYVAECHASDLDTITLLSALDGLVDTPTRRMINTLPQYNFHLAMRKLLAVVACAAHIADHINTYALEYQVPIPQALKRTSLRHCSMPMLQETAPDQSGCSPDGLDARALGIVRRIAEESIMQYHGHSVPDALTPATLLAYMTSIYTAANLQKL